MKRRLGWLGPAIVLLGVAIAGLATWFMIASRPEVGAVIDTIAIDDKRALLVRAEAGGDRNFIELRDGDKTVWQAIVPTYAGRPGAPGIAYGKLAVSVRVIRSGRAEVFAIALANGSKLGGFKLAPDHGDVTKQTSGPVTLTDHERSYEIVSGAGWNQLVAIDLATGSALWKQELGATPIEAGGVEAGSVWILQSGRKRAFRVADGVETSAATKS
jgi:hypothetical protein